MSVVAALLVFGAAGLFGYSFWLLQEATAARHSAEVELNTARVLRDQALIARAPKGEGGSVSPTQRERAALWFSEQGLDLEALQQAPERERARAATFLAWRFCEPGDATPADLNELYSSCLTRCGGYAYVLRGLAEALGLKSRFVNLYNIPQQGNHVAVELRIDEEWGFYDATFGAYFSETGTPDGRPLGLEEIIAQPREALAKRVVQADRVHALDMALSSDVWSPNFAHEFMDIENYRVAEAVTQGIDGETLMLRIPLRLGQPAGSFTEVERSTLSASWLSYTNKTLTDDDPLNDTSYSAYLLSNREHDRATVLSISNAQPGQLHSIRIRAFNPSTDAQRLQVSSIGKRSRLVSGRVVPLQQGQSDFEIQFIAASENPRLVVRNIDTGVVELYAFDTRSLGG